MRLAESLPELAKEIASLFVMAKEPTLAAQVNDLQIVDRCRCKDDFCSSFYTAPKPSGPYGSDHKTVELLPRQGWIILDVVEDRIAHIEVLYRDDVKSQLDALFH